MLIEQNLKIFFKEWFKKSIPYIKQSIEDVKSVKKEIDEFIFIYDPSRIPKIQKIVWN